jgi:TP901 family phage tail tape measure protein
MGMLGDLLVRVGADISGFDKAMGNVSTRLNATMRDADKMFSGFDRLGDKLTSLGTTLSLGITAPLAAAGAASLKFYGDFESSMNRVSALGEITGTNLDKLKQQALDLGAKTQYSAKQAADGMGELAAAGFSTTEIMAAMPAVLNLAASGQLEVGRAAEIAANLMAGFGIPAQDVGKAVDVIAKAAASGSLSVEDLGLTFKYVGPIATAAGLSFEEVTAAITLMSNAGIKGEQAGTSLRGAMAKLLDPSREAAEVLDRLGITAVDSSGKLVPLASIVEQLGNKGATTKDIFKIFGQESASGITALVNTGAPALQRMTAELTSSEGAAQKMADTLQKGMGGALERMKGSVETAAISLGESLAPVAIRLAGVIENLANKVADFGRWFAGLPEPVQNAAIAIGVLAAAIGPVVLVAGQLISAFATVGSAVSGLSGLLGLGGGLAGILSVGTPLLIAFGAALAAWAIYEAVTKVSALNKELDRLYDLQQRGIKATQEQADKIIALESAIAAHNKQVGAQKIAIDSTGKSVEQYVSELENAVKGLDEYKGVQKQANVVTKDGKINLLDAVKAAKSYTGEVKTTEKAVKDTATANKGLGDAVKETGAKHETAKVAVRQFNDEILLTKYGQWAAEHKKLAGEIATLQRGLESGKIGAAAYQSELASVDLVTKLVAQSTSDIATRQIPELVKAMGGIKAPVDQLGEAFKTLNVVTFSSVQEKADKAKQAYETIRNSGVATANEILQAERAALQASIEARKAAGEEVTKADIERLNQLNAALGDHAEKQKSIWKDLGNQVSTIMTDLSRGIADAIWSGKSIGEVFMSAFEEAGKAVTRFVIEYLEKQLLKALAGLLDDWLPKVGSAIAGAFGFGSDAVGVASDVAGGAASAAGGASSAAGSAAGAAGSAASGALGIINAVSGVVSAIGSIGTMIGSWRQEGTLNAIEHEVRYSQIHLSYILEKLNEYLPGVQGIESRITQLLEFDSWRIHDVWEQLVQLNARWSDEVARATVDTYVWVSTFLGTISQQIGELIELTKALPTEFGKAFMPTDAGVPVPSTITVSGVDMVSSAVDAMRSAFEAVGQELRKVSDAMIAGGRIIQISVPVNIDGKRVADAIVERLELQGVGV